MRRCPDTARFMKEKMLGGYAQVPGGQRDPECTHVIMGLEEYEDLLGRISAAEQDARIAKSEADRAMEEVHRESRAREQRTAQEANRIIETWKKALEEEQEESARQRELNKNLLRIARERANAQRKLTPKKQHSGYAVVMSSEKVFRYKAGRKVETVTLWETVIQSPYSVEFSAEQAKNLILQEFFPNDGEWKAAKLGIHGWSPGDYGDLLRHAEPSETPGKENVALGAYQAFRANYRAGYWELVLVHTKPLGIVPNDMRLR